MINKRKMFFCPRLGANEYQGFGENPLKSEETIECLDKHCALGATLMFR